MRGSGGVLIGQFDNYTGPFNSLNKENVPQSNVTRPDKSNVVTVTVFGNLYEEQNTADIPGEVSVQVALRHISA